MMSLDKALLHYFIQDALFPYSDDFSFDGRENPVRFSLNGKKYSVHVSYVHDSGNSRANDDEVRIQIQRSLIDRQREREQHGVHVAFLGFFEGGELFVAWDPRHVFSLNASRMVSVYARQSMQEAVIKNRASAHKFHAKSLGEDSLAIALPSAALGLYLENIEGFHRLPTESSVVRLLEKSADVLEVKGSQSIEFEMDEDGQREKFTYERKSYPRDPLFKKLVMSAYDCTCCVCGRQLGLVQAAHIIPHSQSDSPNSIQNGLALCIEHHKLYDDALLLPGPGGRLIYNKDRADYLDKINQGEGLREVELISKKNYTVPDDASLRPSDEYLRKGVEIRLGREDF